MIKNLSLFLIALYQKWISPFFGNSCMFFPTCSEYTKESIIKYGVFKGSYKGFRRILKCNPLFSKPQIDQP